MPTTSGAEVVQTMVAMMVKRGLPDQLARQRAAWESADKVVAKALQVPYKPTKIEPVEAGSYMLGDRPSVLKMPWSFFPSLNICALDVQSSPESRSHDYGSVFSVPFYLELIVPCDPYPNQDPEQALYQQGLVDRRAKRMSDAVVQILLSDRSLGGIAPEEDLGLRVRQTQPFMIKGSESDDRGYTCIFSLVRIDAQVDVYAALPGVETVSALLPRGVGLGT